MALIKLRSEKTGKLYNADGISFVELCTDDNKLVGVVKVNEALGLVELLRPGDTSFFKYTTTFGRDTGEMLDVNLTWLERKRNAMLQ